MNAERPEEELPAPTDRGTALDVDDLPEDAIPRPWYRRTRYLVALGALFAIGLVLAAFALTRDDSQPTADQDDPAVAGDGEGADEPAPSPPTAEAGIGEQARDEHLAFVVRGIECGRTNVGGEQAEGRFCLLTLRVTNEGPAPLTLSADHQRLLDVLGRAYGPDLEATSLHDPASAEFLTEIPQDETVEGTIVFDVPADADIGFAELHDAALSDGVVVGL